MEQIDNLMNIKAPRTDVNQNSALAGKAVDKNSGESQPAADAASVNRDTVTFTNAAATMLKLEENLASIPDIDNSRISAIKASIEDGSYNIDADKIVDNLLKIEREIR